VAVSHSPDVSGLPHHRADNGDGDGDGDGDGGPSQDVPRPLQNAPEDAAMPTPVQMAASAMATPMPTSLPTYDDDARATSTPTGAPVAATEAITGDLEITDDVLRDALVNGRTRPVPELDLADPSGDGAWRVLPDANALTGAYVLAANTRRVVQDVPANAHGIVMYRGQATLSFAVVAGPRGGTLRFAVWSDVHAPVDVLEVGLDGVAVLAATSPSDRWEKHSLDLDPGRHVLTFTHISNPADLPMRTIEALGRPGSSRVDGLQYIDRRVDPPGGAPTPPSIPPQNYCGASLAEVRDSCRLEENAPPTCNDGDGPCPAGTFCWGHVACERPAADDETTMEEFLEVLVPENEEEAPDVAWMEDAPEDAEQAESIPQNAVVLPQNYCAGSHAAAEAECASGTLTTCNEGDATVCPVGTGCWRNIECSVVLPVQENEEKTPDIVRVEDALDIEWAENIPQIAVVPSQNYCAGSLASAKEECASGTLTTCNEGDTTIICPVGTACWRDVECSVASSALPAPSPPQNYCGTSRASIEATCASDAVPTCNDGDAPCATGTFCWGAVACAGPRTAAPTASPVKEEKGSSFLSAFFASNSNNNAAHQTEGRGAAGEASAEEAESPPEQQAVDRGEPDAAVDVEYSEEGHDCPEGTSSPPGMPACCVPDPTFLGDGACDVYAPFNTEECGYDLGDCCRESCRADTTFGCAAKEGDDYGPFGFYCLDPAHGGGAIDEEACGAERREWVGDGGCDPEHNTAACGWDGGDCCRETCDEKFAYFECGRESQPFSCKNPDIIYRADYVP